MEARACADQRRRLRNITAQWCLPLTTCPSTAFRELKMKRSFASGYALLFFAFKGNHPVVDIAYEDAFAYAKWLGRSLPTEAQWEFAARGGRDGEDDWSSAFDPEGKPIANSWQGIFPLLNTNEDGYAETAPVGCFPPNGYGLYDMIGNVWEWTSDWYRSGHLSAAATNPIGPELISLRVAAGQTPSRVIKGGSYLCSMNYCARYRSAARQAQESDLAAAHLGFRTVLNRANH